jgi:hypothetical protein
MLKKLKFRVLIEGFPALDHYTLLIRASRLIPAGAPVAEVPIDQISSTVLARLGIDALMVMLMPTDEAHFVEQRWPWIAVQMYGLWSKGVIVTDRNHFRTNLDEIFQQCQDDRIFDSITIIGDKFYLIIEGDPDGLEDSNLFAKTARQYLVEE